MAVIAIICLWAVHGTYTAGWSGLLALLGRAQSTTDAEGALKTVEAAVAQAPDNPEAHLAHGSVLQAQRKYTAAVATVERALALRPQDYFLWLELGRMRDSADDVSGALAAFRQAVKLAPYYGDVHWQLGNILLRNGAEDEGFAELRQAALSDNTFWPGLIDLAWSLRQGNVAGVEQLLKIDSASPAAAVFALAHFYVKHSQPAAALRVFALVPHPPQTQQRTLQSELMGSRYYSEARVLWLQTEGRQGNNLALTDGGFEEPLNTNETGFGWRLWHENANLLQITPDNQVVHSGKYSLRLVYSGDTGTGVGVLSQIIAVKPDTNYVLSFNAKTQQLVTGGLPLLYLIGETAASRNVLTRSALLPGGTTGWQSYEVAFNSGRMQNIIIELQRMACSSSPCPIFGTLWLDDFTLRESR